MDKKVYSIILDGFALAPKSEGNAITLAQTPFLDQLFDPAKMTRLTTHGEAVGLPEFQVGGSEVGHITIGAGRPVKHILTKINDQIEDGSFFEKDLLTQLFAKAQKTGRIHFLGLLSDGGVHSFLPHLWGLGKMAKDFGINDVYVHGLLDGRDVPVRTAKTYLKQVEKNGIGKLASIGGRFFGMDRDNNWDRILPFYEVLTAEKTSPSGLSWDTIIDDFYATDDRSDEFVPPQLLNKKGQIAENDVVICFNFRTDRMRQIMTALCAPEFKEFDRPFVANPQNFGLFGNYYDQAKVIFSLSSEPIPQTLGQLVSDAGGTQLRAAETEKFNHVTFFFSGERKELFPGEERLLVPSVKVPSYAQAPAMSAAQLTKEILEKLKNHDFNLVVHNYANADMVGHSADIPATIAAVETLESEMKRLLPVLQAKGYDVIVFADHGNSDQMLMPDGTTPCPTHSKNLVPFRLISADETEIALRKAGTLADVAPTICELLGLTKPKEMTGKSLL